MKRLVNFCDYFVLCSGSSDRQVSAIVDGIQDGFAKLGIKIPIKQRGSDSSWIVLDVGDVIIHVFQKDVREFYRLEYLWQEAKAINWEKIK